MTGAHQMLSCMQCRSPNIAARSLKRYVCDSEAEAVVLRSGVVCVDVPSEEALEQVPYIPSVYATPGYARPAHARAVRHGRGPVWRAGARRWPRVMWRQATRAAAQRPHGEKAWPLSCTGATASPWVQALFMAGV